MTVTIDRECAEQFMRSVDDPADHGVHILCNQFWQYAPEEVRAAYEREFLAHEANRRYDSDRGYAEPMTIERLAACPAGSLGEAAHRFITANGLEEKLATNYRTFHDALQASGMLDGMPEALHAAVLRGFQLHDLLHVVAGYGPSPTGEISLQAFCLAQTNFPYSSMWVAVVTARMTFIDPTSTGPLMDAIADGWRSGRQARSVQFEPWEERLGEPLADLRAEFGLPVDGCEARAESGLVG